MLKISKEYFLQTTKFCEGNKESFETLKNILFFHMPSSKIIIYRSRLSRLMIIIYFLEFQFLKKVFA